MLTTKKTTALHHGWKKYIFAASSLVKKHNKHITSEQVASSIYSKNVVASLSVCMSVCISLSHPQSLSVKISTWNSQFQNFHFKRRSWQKRNWHSSLATNRSIKAPSSCLLSLSLSLSLSHTYTHTHTHTHVSLSFILYLCIVCLLKEDADNKQWKNGHTSIA